MVKTSTFALCVLVAFAIGIAVGMSLQRTYYPCIEIPVVSKTDTLYLTDTVPGEIPDPEVRWRVRTDTMRVKITPDGKTTVDGVVLPDTTRKDSSGQQIDVAVPISSKVYQTPDYRAVVSGWNAALDSMTLYPRTKVITNTETRTKRPRWVLAVGPGLSYTDRQVRPAITATLGFAIWSK